MCGNRPGAVRAAVRKQQWLSLGGSAGRVCCVETKVSVAGTHMCKPQPHPTSQSRPAVSLQPLSVCWRPSWHIWPVCNLRITFTVCLRKNMTPSLLRDN